MNSSFFESLVKVFTSWKFWLVVAPWEVGVRVRLGRQAKKLLPGLHFRIPFVDEVHLVNTRMRVTTTPPVTVKSDGGVRVRRAIVTYMVHDPLRAMMRYGNPGAIVKGIAQALITRRGYEDARDVMRTYFEGTGIDVLTFELVEDVEVPAFRIMQNSWDDVHEGPQSEPTAGIGRY